MHGAFSQLFLNAEKLVMFATRSVLLGAPVFIWQVFSATTKCPIGYLPFLPEPVGILIAV